MEENEKRRLSGFKYIVIAGVYALSLLSLTPYISLQSKLIDLPSHFALQYAVGAVLLLLGVRYYRLPQACYVLSIAALAINLVTLAPYFPISSDAAVSGRTLKILQANVLFLNDNTDALKTLIKAEDPDLIVAAEVNDHFAAMFNSLADYPGKAIWPENNNARGLAVLSKTPLQHADRAYYEDLKIPSASFQLAVGEKTIQFVSVHPYTPLVNLQSRDALFTGITTAMQQQKPENLVILGDFNATPYCHALQKLTQDLALRNARQGKGLLGTWPVFFPTALLHIPIDQFLASDNIVTTDYHTGPDIGSDHLPSLITLSFKAP